MDQLDYSRDGSIAKLVTLIRENLEGDERSDFHTSLGRLVGQAIQEVRVKRNVQGLSERERVITDRLFELDQRMYAFVGRSISVAAIQGHLERLLNATAVVQPLDALK